MISIGYRNYVSPDRIVSIVLPSSRPVKAMISGAREEGMLVDATMGKKTKSVLVLDSRHVVLSANSVETLVGRVRDYFARLAYGDEEVVG